jgi:hypothetical protein
LETCHYRAHASRRSGLFKDPACITRSKDKVNCSNCRRSVAFLGIAGWTERREKRRDAKKAAAALARLNRRRR